MLKLSPKQCSLLHHLELDAGLSAAELAVRARMKPAMVLYYTRRFREGGLITARQPIIDGNGLGFTHYTVYLTLKIEAQRVVDKIIKYLSSAPQVTWVFELSGEYQLAFTISAEKPFEVNAALQDLLKAFPGMIFDKAICTQIAFAYLGRRYLKQHSVQSRSKAALNFHARPAEKFVDALDLKILSAMANRGESSGTMVAKLLGEPIATINRRISEMERRGVIIGYFHWIDAHKLGRSCYLLRIKIRGIAQCIAKSINNFIAEVPEVIFGLQCFGPWDYEIGVEVASDTEILPIVRKLNQVCGEQIYPVSSVTILEYHKFHSFPATLHGSLH